MPLAKVIGKGHFRPPDPHSAVTPEPIWITLVMYNYTPQATHHAKFHFDPTTWVVWAKPRRIASLPLFGCLSSFLPFFVFFGSPTTRAGGRIVTILRLVDVFCAKDVPFGG